MPGRLATWHTQGKPEERPEEKQKGNNEDYCNAVNFIPCSRDRLYTTKRTLNGYGMTSKTPGYKARRRCCSTGIRRRDSVGRSSTSSCWCRYWSIIQCAHTVGDRNRCYQRRVAILACPTNKRMVVDGTTLVRYF
jgi:hypothetical protein